MSPGGPRETGPSLSWADFRRQVAGGFKYSLRGMRAHTALISVSLCAHLGRCGRTSCRGVSPAGRRAWGANSSASCFVPFSPGPLSEIRDSDLIMIISKWGCLSLHQLAAVRRNPQRPCRPPTPVIETFNHSARLSLNTQRGQGRVSGT